MRFARYFQVFTRHTHRAVRFEQYCKVFVRSESGIGRASLFGWERARDQATREESLSVLAEWDPNVPYVLARCLDKLPKWRAGANG